MLEGARRWGLNGIENSGTVRSLKCLGRNGALQHALPDSDASTGDQ